MTTPPPLTAAELARITALVEEREQAFAAWSHACPEEADLGEEAVATAYEALRYATTLVARETRTLLAEVQRLREAQRWRTVATDGLPAAGERVLVREVDSDTYLAEAKEDGEGEKLWVTDTDAWATHSDDRWLPEPVPQDAPVAGEPEIPATAPVKPRIATPFARSPSGPVDLYRCGACGESTWFTSPPCSPLEYPCQACNTLVRGSDWKLIPAPEPTP